jgi:hypothetical protein
VCSLTRRWGERMLSTTLASWSLQLSLLSPPYTWKRERFGPVPMNALLCFITSPSSMRRCAQTKPLRLGSIPEGPQCWFQRPSGRGYKARRYPEGG